MTTKQVVHTSVLEYLSKILPLHSAQIVTLGGRGEVTAVWQDSGIGEKCGWLVERSRAARTTIGKTPFRVHNSLLSFPKVFGSINGPEAGVDLFDLDLSGTIEAARGELECILPLVLKGTGRCLAVTVSDSRRNETLENWREARSTADRLFGRGDVSAALDVLVPQLDALPKPSISEAAPSFFSRGGADPVKCARRELGFITTLVQALELKGLPLPADVQRYVYISEYAATKSFRMRTYLVHFAAGAIRRQTVSKGERAGFLSRWLKSSLFFGRDGNISPAPLPARTQPEVRTMKKRTEPESQPPSRLAAIAEAAGHEVLAEYQSLVAERDEFRDKAAKFDAAVALFGGSVPTAAQSRPSGPPPGKVTAREGQKRFEALSELERTLMQLEMLEADAKGYGGSFFANLSSRFGNSVDVNRCLRALHASIGNGHFNRWLKKASKQVPDTQRADVLKRAAAALSKKRGEAVTVDAMLKEAGLS